jgi:hypothetical protein
MNNPTFQIRRISVRAIFLWAVPFFSLLPVWANATVSQIHLSWQNDPATTMTVVWSTAKNHTPPQVQYGTTLLYENSTGGIDSTHGGILHTVEMTGLTPDTLYQYRVSDDKGAWSSGMTFRTAPVLGQSGTGGLVVTVTGDKGPYSDAQAVNQQIAAQNADLHLIVGDLAYISDDDDRYHEWFDKQQDYARFAPMMPAWGNHDTTERDPPYSFAQAHFALPTHATKDERYYSYTVGNTHFVVADSNADAVTAPGSPQYKWLENDLAAAARNPKIEWIIVYFHHNIYSAGGKYSNTATPVREHLQPLFDRYGVDLVFHGHIHYYSRSMPVAYNEAIKDRTHTSGTPDKYNFAGKDHGQIYITTGGGGKPLYSCPDKPPAFIIQCADAYSLGTFTINGPNLTYKAIRSDGSLLDDGFAIVKSVGNDHSKGTMQFHPIDDTMVDQALPSKSYGHNAQMEVDKMEKGGKKTAYLKFNITGILEPITQAKLQLTTAAIPFADSDSTGLIYPVSDTTWTEKTVNWDNRPAHDPSPLAHNRSKTIGKNETTRFDLSSVIRENGLYSFAISSDSTDGVAYNTKEAKEGQPVLILTWGKQVPLPLPAPPQKSETVAYLFNPMHDGTVREASPDENHGHSTTLTVDQKSNGGEAESYLMFNVTGITGAVVKATLSLKTKNHPDAESDQSGLLYSVESNQWDQNSLTWKNRPRRSTTPIGEILSDPIGVDQTKQFDITSVIKKEGLYSFAIASTSSNGVLYRSKEDSGAKPVIEVIVAP